MTEYQKMLFWLGGLICRMKKRHEWSREYQALNWAAGTKQKRCIRCDETRAIRRYIKKEKA